MELIHKSFREALSNLAEVEYAGKINETTYFVIYRPERDNDWNTFRVLIGPRTALQTVDVTGGMRYKCGTTVINTAQGTFFIPPVQRKDKQPLFNGQPIYLF